jgi:hypothetical protein
MFWSIVWGVVVGGLLLIGIGFAFLILMAAVLKAAAEQIDE